MSADGRIASPPGGSKHADEAILRAPADDGDSLSSTRAFELLGARRLAWLAGLGAALGLGAAVLQLARQPNVGIRAGTERPLWVVPAWAALSLAVFFVARAKRLEPRTRLDVGLAFLVASGFAAGVFRHALPYADSDVVRGVSPIALAVMFFAAVIPVRPTRMAVAAALAGVADMVALAVTSRWMSPPPPPWNLWLWLLFPNLVVVFVAFVTSRFLHRLAESVRREREMGGYRLVRKLGVGGMGEVWSAEHRSLARPAAIKLVRPELLGVEDAEMAERLLTRFEREAKATAALTSPHTIGVYDYGHSEQGNFYYVMELLEGMDLETLVEQHGALPQARAVYLLEQICDSLADAHAHGVVHRDIKPANIMACKQGTEHDFIKVLDFGLVKVEREGESKLTADGAILGTPAYMAPETARGDEASPASDLYAFGCVAHWLLSGQLVFVGKNAPVQQILAHIDEAPRPLTDVVAGIDPALSALVTACLEKKREARPAGMAEVAAALAEMRLSEGWTRADRAGWWAEVERSSPPESSPAREALALAPTMADTGA